jgi:hypothetical protein
MRVVTRIARAPQTLVFGLILLAACVSAGPQKLRTSPSSAVDRDVMTAAEIAESQATTAYQAIERLRPRFLLSRVDLGPTLPRLVFLNGMVLGGGVEELRAIAASDVREIRFVRAIDAANEHFGGGIFVVSKVGR